VTIQVARASRSSRPIHATVVSAGLQAAVHGAAVTDINDHDMGLVVLHTVNDPPRADPDPQQPATTGESFDLGRRGIISEIQQGVADAVADDWVERFVLLAGTRGQFDLVRGHLLSALGEFSVNVGKPVSAPVVGVPLG